MRFPLLRADSACRTGGASTGCGPRRAVRVQRRAARVQRRMPCSAGAPSRPPGCAGRAQSRSGRRRPMCRGAVRGSAGGGRPCGRVRGGVVTCGGSRRCGVPGRGCVCRPYGVRRRRVRRPLPSSAHPSGPSGACLPSPPAPPAPAWLIRSVPFCRPLRPTAIVGPGGGEVLRDRLRIGRRGLAGGDGAVAGGGRVCVRGGCACGVGGGCPCGVSVRVWGGWRVVSSERPGLDPTPWPRGRGRGRVGVGVAAWAWPRGRRGRGRGRGAWASGGFGVVGAWRPVPRRLVPTSVTAGRHRAPGRRARTSAAVATRLPRRRSAGRGAPVGSLAVPYRRGGAGVGPPGRCRRAGRP